MSYSVRLQLMFFMGLFFILSLAPDLALAADPEGLLEGVFQAWINLLTGKWVVLGLSLVIIGAGFTTFFGIMPLRTLVYGSIGIILILGGVTLGTYIYDAVA